MTVRAPEHLRPATAEWWRSVAAEYELEEHHRRLLLAAGEAWDRMTEAREALAEHGVVFHDRFGAPRARPEVAIERDSRLAFGRLLSQLDLRGELPPPPTPRASGRRV